MFSMRVVTAALVAGGVALAGAASESGQPPPEAGDGPRYINQRDLIRPDDYREWRFLSSGLGMTYEAERPPPAGLSSSERVRQPVVLSVLHGNGEMA